MNWLDKILLPKDTIELAELNKIWEAFNEKRLTPKQTQHELLKRAWKFHLEKVQLLLDFINYQRR